MKTVKELLGGLEEATKSKKMKGADPCWAGYEMVGTKKKNGKEVPNCVPKTEEVELDEASSDRIIYHVHKDGKPTGDSFSHKDPEKARNAAHSFVHDNAAIKDTSRYSIVKKSATKVRGGVKVHNEEVEIEETLTYKQKLHHIRVDSTSKTSAHLLGKVGEFGAGKNLGNDEHYNKALADAHAYGKDKFAGNYEITHVDANNHKIRGGSVSKVRKSMAEEVEIEEGIISTAPIKKVGHNDIVVRKHPSGHHEVVRKGAAYMHLKKGEKLTHRDMKDMASNRAKFHLEEDAELEESTKEVETAAQVTKKFEKGQATPSGVPKWVAEPAKKKKKVEEASDAELMSGTVSKPTASGNNPKLAAKFVSAFRKAGVEAKIKCRTINNISACEDVNVAFTEAVKKDEVASDKEIKKGEKLSGKQEPIKINPPLPQK